MNILLLYPEFPDTFWGFKHAVKFVGKKTSNPPLGLVTVAAMLPKEWNKRLVDMNIAPLRQDDLEWADFVFLSAMDVQRASVISVIARCKASGVKVVAGGPLFTEEHEKYEDVDYFVLNEAEITLPLFLSDLESGQLRRVYATQDYPEITTTPIPLYELLDLKAYDSMSLQFSRGCPFNCDFCNVTALLGHRPRTKTKDQVIAELDRLYELGWRRNIFFVDDNFIGNRKILKQEVLPALVEWRKGKKGNLFITEVSINLADDPELMQLMADAGFINVFVGIETPDEDSLTECNKKQNVGRDLVASVRRMQHAGLQVMGGFIVGFDSDSPTIFQRQIDFIQESGIVAAMVGLLQAPFGTELFRRMEREGRILQEISGDNADGSTNIIPKMDLHVLQNGYFHIMEEIFSPRMFYKRVRNFLTEYKPHRVTVTLAYDEIMALLRSVWLLGVLGRERMEYWRLFFWTIFHYPTKFPIAITMSIYGHHFRTVSEAHISARKIASQSEKIVIGKQKLVTGQPV